MAKIVSVHSFRGGTGKSNITANLAVTLACRGLRVGIIDTDIQSPGIHVLFNLDEGQINRALNDYLWDRCAIEDTAYAIPLPAVTKRGGSIYLVPSSIKAGEIARVLREGYDIERLSAGVGELIQELRLDYLFIDTHPGLNEETLLSFAFSDLVVLILRPDQQDFQGTAVTVEVARKLDVPRLLLVVNKALPSLDLAALRRQVEGTYHATVGAVLPLSEDLVRLASGGVFCLVYPDHPVTREIQRLAATIADEWDSEG
jgi:MinD-like ATPase involved in chromosome partitioning or flagellar assembly